MGERKEIPGIVGGMGPAATNQFMHLVTSLTPAHCDQDHIRMLVDMNPTIPDRTAAILGRGPSPVPKLVESSRLLEKAGATFLVFPCNTAHYFLPQVKPHINVPILNMIQETAAFIESQEINKIALLATDGTVRTGIYQQALAGRRLSCVVPDKEAQEAIMKTIYDIKADGDLNKAKLVFSPVIRWCHSHEVEAIIAGCTELSLILTADTYQCLKVIDPMKVMAQRLVDRVLGQQTM